MMFEEPDLIDADTFPQLDFFELPPEHFHMCRIFAWGRGRPDGESHLPPSRFKRRRAARRSQLVLWSAPRRVSSIAPDSLHRRGGFCTLAREGAKTRLAESSDNPRHRPCG